MSNSDDQLARLSTLAIHTAAKELGLKPLTLARRLGQAEIARLVHLLNAALRHVEHAGLRHRIEDLLIDVTDGRMPTENAESELDWALKVARRRRERQEPDERPDDGPDDFPDGGPDDPEGET